MTQNFFRRKKSLVDREVQFGFAGLILKYLLLYTLFLLGSLVAPVMVIYKMAEGDENARAAAIGNFITGGATFWVLVAIFIGILTVHSIFATRKFAGPIFVIRRHLRRAQNGELARINLRREDSFHDLKDIINDHFDQLSDTMNQIKNSIESATQQIDHIENNLNGTPQKISIQDSCVKTREELTKINNICRKSWSYSE